MIPTEIGSVSYFHLICIGSCASLGFASRCGALGGGGGGWTLVGFRGGAVFWLSVLVVEDLIIKGLRTYFKLMDNMCLTYFSETMTGKKFSIKTRFSFSLKIN